MAIGALCCGIVSVIVGCPCGLIGAPLAIAAMVLGIITLNRFKVQPGRFSDASKPMAIVGIAGGGVALLLGAVMTVVGAAGQFLHRF